MRRGYQWVLLGSIPDWVSTFIGMTVGLEERNPFIRYFWDIGKLHLWWILELFILYGFVWGIYWFQEQASSRLKPFLSFAILSFIFIRLLASLLNLSVILGSV